MGNEPKRKVKEGGIEIAVWENINKKDGSKSLSYSLQKRYKAADGVWKNSGTYFDKELLTLKKLIDQVLADDANNPE